MTLQEALRLPDIVTDVNEQYSKQERIRAAMRLEEPFSATIAGRISIKPRPEKSSRGFSCPFQRLKVYDYEHLVKMFGDDITGI